jgi:hypothetical protein
MLNVHFRFHWKKWNISFLMKPIGMSIRESQVYSFPDPKPIEMELPQQCHKSRNSEMCMWVREIYISSGKRPDLRISGYVKLLVYRHVPRPGLSDETVLVFPIFLALCFLSDLVTWQILNVDDANFNKFSSKAQIMSENELFFVKCTKVFIECKVKTRRTQR